MTDFKRPEFEMATITDEESIPDTMPAPPSEDLEKAQKMLVVNDFREFCDTLARIWPYKITEFVETTSYKMIMADLRKRIGAKEAMKAAEDWINANKHLFQDEKR